jgi:hypothetical protein
MALIRALWWRRRFDPTGVPLYVASTRSTSASRSSGKTTAGGSVSNDVECVIDTAPVSIHPWQFYQCRHLNLFLGLDDVTHDGGKASVDIRAHWLRRPPGPDPLAAWSLPRRTGDSWQVGQLPPTVQGVRGVSYFNISAVTSSGSGPYTVTITTGTSKSGYVPGQTVVISGVGGATLVNGTQVLACERRVLRVPPQIASSAPRDGHGASASAAPFPGR